MPTAFARTRNLPYPSADLSSLNPGAPKQTRNLQMNCNHKGITSASRIPVKVVRYLPDRKSL